MNKLIITLALLLLPILGGAMAQISNPTPTPGGASISLYLAETGIHNIWSDYDDYLWRKIATVGDIKTKLLIDEKYLEWNSDSTKMQTTYYGKAWLVDRCDSLIGVALAGYDSSTVTIYYRALTKAGDIVAARPWAQYGAATTFTNSTKSGGAAHDSLVTVTGVIAWATAWSQLVQFKYVVVSNKTLLAAKTKKHMSSPGRSQTSQEIWRGQALPRFKRTEL